MTPRYLLSASLLVFLGGCTLHEVDTKPRPDVPVPKSFQSGAQGKLDTDNRWWLVFQDAQLNALVEATVANNLDVKRAWARLGQARALAVQAGAAAYPQIDAGFNLSMNQSQNPARNFGIPGFEGDTFLYFGNGSLSISIAYEVDLWGRVSSTKKAAALDVAAARQDVSALALTMAAQVVEAWMSIAEAKTQLALIEKQREINDTYLKLLEERFKFGQADSVAIFQQRQALAASTAQVPLVEGRIKLLKYQLATLQGRPAGAFQAEPAGTIPVLPAPPATGLPADVIKNRPDVRAAQMRIVAADYRVGVAIADQYPALRLTGSTGLNGQSQLKDGNIMDFFTGWIWNLAGGLVAPLFDGHRRSAEVERTKVVVNDLIHAYGNTVLTALKEVEDALVQEQQQRKFLDRLEGQLKLADATLGEARTRYLEGGGDYLSVLTAIAAKQNLELQELTAQRTLLTHRIALYRALGGTWPGKLRQPPPRRKKSENASEAESTPEGEKGQ